MNKDSGERENKQLREDDEEETVKHKELKLRNYEPEDEELKKRKVPQAKPASVEDKVKDQLEAAKPEPIIDEVDLANLAPRKPDWDLKRDVAKKLEKLEKRTQRAIAELIRVLSCRRDGVWGHQLFQRDYTILIGSSVPCCWVREGLVELDPLPKRVCEAVHPK
ncbi:PREDICTED: coiled-coil domain-containing protein 12 isoform X1 [Haliaeetus leucocephalus]|uniref:coiled-coil domain-containing protein 12 isoform X1 n=1 Tax=Haliaeetus leucocephalus TaxID=52644 RepID=UPI000522462A|nr:PREDICTED: coiled-coil domain-containing protein 12 isoform X1 [Haliaeetus albicilla]XP_010560164.1 PREDICTED: coiled-coil domain-containing protein 12 isoform X1 [Haliaeetus leucocephalus]